MEQGSYRGVIVPAVTPFTDDLALDLPGLEKVLTHFDNHRGIDGLFITGATGDFALLTLEERKQVVDLVCTLRLAKPWLINTGTRDWATTMELTRYAASRGIPSVGAILPAQCKTFEDVVRFLGEILAMGLKVFVYQNGESPYALSADELDKVADLGGVLGMKDSCSPRDFYRHIRYIAQCGDRLTVIQGVEMLYLSSLAMGIQGCIGGGCNIYPHLIQRIAAKYSAGDVRGAREDQELVNRLCEQWFLEGSGTESIKYYLTLCGVDIGWHSRRGTVVSERKQRIMRDIYEMVEK